MSLVISDFSRRVASLIDVLESAFQKSGNSTNTSIASISVHKVSCGAIHDDGFLDLQRSLRHAFHLPYSRPGRVLFVYTDVFRIYWSGVVDQATTGQLRLSLEQQKHEPLAFIGGAFKGEELNWTTFEQESYAIFSKT